MSTNLKPRLNIDCSACPANVHERPESNELIHVVGNCGDKKTLGGCYGVILYPFKNPSAKVMSRLQDLTTLNNEANTVAA